MAFLPIHNSQVGLHHHILPSVLSIAISGKIYKQEF